MEAKLLIRRKVVYPDTAIAEFVVWQLPQADPERPHGYKYRFYYGKHGQRLVGYDNERGKGDHRHYIETELAYEFVSIHQLLADFERDIVTLRGKDNE